MTFRNRQAKTLAYLCAATALAACSPNPEAGRPNVTPSASRPGSASATSSPSSQPSPTASPPVRPTAASGLTLGAAEAFVRHYVDLLNYSSATGDTSPLLSASDSGCRQCQVYANYVKKVNAANGGLTGDYLERVKDIPDLFRGDSGRLGGYAAVSIGAYTSKDSPTAKPVTSVERTYKREFTLAPQEGAWVMYEMELVPQ